MIVDDEESDKKKKSLSLKVEEEKDLDSNEDMKLLVRKFKRFMSHDKRQDFQQKNKGRSSFVPTYYQYDKKGHLNSNFPQN